MISKYFNWLQKDNPVGEIERYPQQTPAGESSLKGVYICGDLTGVPLIKLAAEDGAEKIRTWNRDASFTSQVLSDSKAYDVIIIGAGPAGVSAGMECERLKLNYLILESGQPFRTIENFPKGKPILAKPSHLEQKSPLKIKGGVKESFLKDMAELLKKTPLKINHNERVEKLSRRDNLVKINTSESEYSSKRVLLAMGKSGDARKLGVPGEDQPKVFNRLFDPADFSGQEILVVGGGDAAIETSIALAKAGNHVLHSYRKDSFSRPKEENTHSFNALVQEGQIEALFSSSVQEIKEKSISIKTKEAVKEFSNDSVFTLIGRELPLSFFRRSGIRMEGDKGLDWWIYLCTMISFFCMLYFGKSGMAFGAIRSSEPWWQVVEYFKAPFVAPLNWSLHGYAWYTAINFILGWLGSLVFMISGTMALVTMFKNRAHYFARGWNVIKYSYLIFSALFFTRIYLVEILGHQGGPESWIEAPTYWYSFFYCSTMALFAWRRAVVKKTTYVKFQMASLVFIQVFFLFLLPFHLYDPFIGQALPEGHWILREVFPNGKWACFSLILFWPLSLWQFGTSSFWTWFPFLQSGVFLFFIVRAYGKGSYCGWICSCGGMAETLGDEYRNKAPHGAKAKKYENIGQWVLLFAIFTTVFSLLSKSGYLSPMVSDTFKGLFKFSIDTIFAGVLGLGVYFFLGGRVWCRFGCPLAALMHIYTRFSKYRILSKKKACISCNVCTKVCHMGIDVMNFANKGIPMNDVECVRCSTCVTSCPMEVLSFSKLEKSDTNNLSREQKPSYGKKWGSGLPTQSSKK